MTVPRQISPTIHQRSPLSFLIILFGTGRIDYARLGSGAKALHPPPTLGAAQCQGGERNETHKKRAALLSSDARGLATGRFSLKHYFEESSKFWRSGSNALRMIGVVSVPC